MKFCVSRPMIFRKTGPWPRSLVPYPSRILHPPPRTRATTYLVRGQRRSGAAARRRRRFSWGVMDLSALALQRVMNIDPADPILALLGEIVEELVSRTANEALRQIFPLLAYELSPHFLLELMADFPQGYCDSIGLPTIDWPLQVPLNYAISHDADRNLEEDLMNVHVAYTLYHRLARLIVLQASLPRNNAESASKASKLSDYIVTKLREVAITKVTRLLPVPIEQWLQQEIASLYARKESILLGNLSPAMKRFFINRTTFQAQDLEHLASDPCYGDKLACCNSVLAIEVFGLQETVNTLVAETTDDVLRVAFPILAFELPNELISQPISDLLPIDYVSLLGLPLLLGKPFSSRDNLNHDTWRAAECQLYTLQATYHRVGRLIILLASLAPSPENAQSSKHLKESIYSLLERCAMIFSRRFGRCMGIPRPVLQWAEKDLDDQKSSIETNGDEDDRALLLDVIQKRDRIVHHNKDYI